MQGECCFFPAVERSETRFQAPEFIRGISPFRPIWSQAPIFIYGVSPLLPCSGAPLPLCDRRTKAYRSLNLFMVKMRNNYAQMHQH